MSSRIQAYRLLEDIHKVGVKHGDLLEDPDRHFLVRGDDVRLVDFDRSRPHQCERSQELYVYDFEPDAAKFGCGELSHFVMNCNMWTPGESSLFFSSYLPNASH